MGRKWAEDWAPCPGGPCLTCSWKSGRAPLPAPGCPYLWWPLQYHTNGLGRGLCPPPNRALSRKPLLDSQYRWDNRHMTMCSRLPVESPATGWQQCGVATGQPLKHAAMCTQPLPMSPTCAPGLGGPWPALLSPALDRLHTVQGCVSGYSLVRVLCSTGEQPLFAMRAWAAVFEASWTGRDPGGAACLGRVLSALVGGDGGHPAAPSIQGDEQFSVPSIFPTEAVDGAAAWQGWGRSPGPALPC